MFQQVELAFLPGIFANRSTRGSKQRWVDGNLVRFKDGVPQQVGGWRAPPVDGALTGFAREMIAWRLNSQLARNAAIGTHTGIWRFDGSELENISPAGFAAGRPDTVVGAGYGAGPYGAEDYGTGRTVGGSLLDASVWTMDMFGEMLVACFNSDGVIYSYTHGADTDLVALANAPSARAIAVSDERHVFAFGADGDPGLVMWSDREDPTVWTPAADNRAGSYNMQATTPFQCGRRVRGLMLGWTASEVFGFAPLANIYVYAYERLSTEAGAAGPQSVCVVTDGTGESAYWMGVDNFYVFEGYVRKLDCELHDYVFSDINTIQRAKFQARSNTLHDEIWFFYCSALSLEIDRAVVYNYAQRIWSKASIARTVWLDSGIFPLPLAIDPENIIHEHETGETAGGDEMGSFVTSHPITVGVGQQFAELDQFWPDMEPASAPCEVSFVCRDYPGGPDVTYGPYAFEVGDDKIDLAIAARQFQLKIAGTAGHWELGVPLVSLQGGSLR